MSDRYVDTSAAVKHYRVETGTLKVDSLLAESGSRSFISSLALVEFDSVFARLVRMGQITAVEFHMARSRVSADASAGVWHIIQVAEVHYQDAQRLLVQYGLTNKVRTLDAIQLAVATDRHGSSRLDEFVSADANLCYLAGVEGLAVVNPEIP
jgi:predicted nucleic acid-binding protein